jgi:hypothetical protein
VIDAEADVHLTDLVRLTVGLVAASVARRGARVGEADLASYIGRYSSDELRISCTLEVVDSELRVRVGHTIDEVLEQRAIGRFEVVDWMRIEFARDAEGAVTGFELKTEGAAGLFFKRE